MTMTSEGPAHRADQQQRSSAIARTAAKVALRDSAESVLSAMAIEIRQTEGIAGAQIILVDSATGSMRMMGSAGFSEDDGFFAILMACHDRGAPLATYEALRTGRQRVYPDRKAEMLADDRWQPMHAYISELEWRDFISTPFRLEGVSSGVINAYADQTGDRGRAVCEFLQTMADQAALTLDYHALIERDRREVRLQERQRLARDLHDSVIQHVFTIGMYARTLKSVVGVAGSAETATQLTTEIQNLVQTVQRDLRGIVRALRPSPAAELGLAEAIRALADGAPRHAGIAVTVDCATRVEPADPEAADDIYYVVSEAVHNAVKHASATTIRVEIAAGPGGITATTTDDGAGFIASEAPVGYGLSAMRYRASRWGGAIAFSPAPDGGTRVRADFPLARAAAVR